MKDGDQSSVYLDSNFKPPDRSTSAPPVLSFPESLFAFRAAEHLQLFSDIRCEDNYYEFYSKYQNQGGKGLPPPLENQPFLIDRTYGEEDEHLINSLTPNSTNPHTSSHQQQIQQLQQQIQQQQAQIQQQQQLQQQLQLHQYIQQHPQQVHSPHHNSHAQHQSHPHQQHMPHPSQHPQQHMQQQQHHLQQQQPHHPHPQSMHHNQMHVHPHLQQQQQPQQQMHQSPSFQQMHVQQPHMRSLNERSYSVPDARNPLPRSTSNPSYAMRTFDTVHEEPSHMDDDMSGDSNRAIWAPHSRGMVGLSDYLDPADDGMHKGQGRHSHGIQQPHRTPPLPQQMPHSRDPSNYYNEDFDNVAYSTANTLLKEDNNLGIARSIWNDRAFDTRAPQQMTHAQAQAHKQQSHITAPTPTVPSSQSALMDLLSNGLFPPAPTADTMLRGINRRRSHSGGVASVPPVPTTSPPLLNSGSASTSPALPICRYYAQGFCSRGERCNFLHDEQSQQALALQQNAGNEQFSIPKQKNKKTIASPPPMSMSNMPPKVPSPVNNSLRLGSGSGNGNGHHANGLGNGVPSSNSGNNTPNNNTTLSSIISSLSNMNLEREGRRDSDRGGRLSPSSMLGLSDIMGGNGSTSPQPIPRSTTPNSNGLADVFANGGSTSPNSKSDMTRQYTSIEQVIGHIYSLCKDQHGCRFLQKKLEDRDSMIVEIIFNEVYDHMTELMIDPFGNYLCQKLLEHCNDDQRLDIIEKVAPDLVKISKNMHGTRAVQKMIEYLTTPEQIAIAKKALSNHVVTLIQDLNGNHVIQRCLNRLSPQDNQFIYDSVSQAGHCVEVATHRHGCCVLQRCIDHASDSQKIQLINEIIANALVLVQDPYGNYVVQYVLDLPFPGLASRLARRFLGHIPILSTQKFSSNVVEKCLNVTDIQTRAATIQELVEYDNLLYLLQDPYANYVIQTSLNVSEPVQHARLVEAIRPHLTSLRNTPYGKRIQNKILKESSRDYYPCMSSLPFLSLSSMQPLPPFPTTSASRNRSS